jgi:hypothetical protein
MFRIVSPATGNLAARIVRPAPTIRTRKGRAASRRFRPGLDCCEERTLLSSLTVSNVNNSGPGSLRAMIAKATAGATIHFNSSLAGDTIHLTSGPLVLKKSLNIDASGIGGVSIDAGGTSRVFEITTAGVSDTLTGLTITGGLAPLGGGILNEGGRLTLNSDTLAGNRAVGVNPGDPGQGGAVADMGAGASLTVHGSTFTSNLAQGAVGPSGQPGVLGLGGDGDGGAIYLDAAVDLTITGSTFNGNQATGGKGGNINTVTIGGTGGSGSGGAIDVGSDGAKVMISATSFIDDQALGGNGGYGAAGSFGGGASGGAIYDVPPGVSSASSTLTIDSSFFIRDLAQGGKGAADHIQSQHAAGGGRAGGGALYVDLADPSNNFSVTITGGAFTHNEAKGGIGLAGTLGGAGGNADGGALDGYDAAVTITGVQFTNNQALGGSGGSGGDGGSGGKGGPAEGGAIEWVEGNGVSLTITGSEILSNSATGGAGGKSGIGGQASSGGNAAGGGLDVFSFGGGSVSVSGSTIAGNRAIGGNGGDGGADSPGGQGGSATGGGIVETGSDGSFLAVTSSQIVGNEASGGDGGNGGDGASAGDGGDANGGGILFFGNSNNGGNVTFALTDSSVIGNGALGGSGGTGGTGGNGGSGGTARGAGVAIEAGQSTGVVATIIGGTLASNGDGGGSGGAGGTGGDGGNGGDAYGGGIEVDQGATLTLATSAVTENTAFAGGAGNGGLGGTTGATGKGLGGGVALGGPGSVRIKTQINTNTASTSGDNVYGKFS